MDEPIADQSTASGYCRCGDAEYAHVEGVFAGPGRHCVVSFCNCRDFRPMDVRAHCRSLIEAGRGERGPL